MEERARQVAALFKLLANENRLLILCALLEKPCNVSELAKHTPGISKPALSQHLSALRLAGIVQDERVGQHVVYRIADPHIERLFSVVKQEYCCAG